MKRVWTLASKDLLETRRDRLALLFTVVMPLAFTSFFGLMFGGGSDRLPLAISSADSSALPSGTTRPMSPISLASWADTSRAVSNRSMATVKGI